MGVALILHLLARVKQPVSALVGAAPRYWIVKAKGNRGKDLNSLYGRLSARFPEGSADTRDGLRISWADRWVHVRPSGTEPIVRFIAEAPTQGEAETLVAACRELMV